jgi:hypothetical protein
VASAVAQPKQAGPELSGPKSSGREQPGWPKASVPEPRAEARRVIKSSGYTRRGSVGWILGPGFDSRRLHFSTVVQKADSSETQAPPKSNPNKGLQEGGASVSGHDSDEKPTLPEPNTNPIPAVFTPLLRHQYATNPAPEAGPLPSGPGPNAYDRIDNIDKTPLAAPALPDDLARLAALWADVPAAVRQGWIATAEALAGKGNANV